jgi:hypothetical protein
MEPDQQILDPADLLQLLQVFTFMRFVSNVRSTSSILSYNVSSTQQQVSHFWYRSAYSASEASAHIRTLTDHGFNLSSSQSSVKCRQQDVRHHGGLCRHVMRTATLQFCLQGVFSCRREASSAAVAEVPHGGSIQWSSTLSTAAGGGVQRRCWP